MPSESRRVLIVDDEPEILKEIADYLAEEGYEVRAAPDGAKALALIEEFRPQVVVLDLKLPDISGIDILRQIRNSYPDIRVIVSTGYVDQAMIDEAESLNRDAFLQKPFDLDTVKREIDQLIG